MKLKINVLLVILSMAYATCSYAQRSVRIAYIDMEYILENVEEYRDATAQLETKVGKWKVKIEQEHSTIEQMKKDLMAEKVLLTDQLIAEREEEIQILEGELVEYQQKRFGPQGDLVLQKQQLIQPIQDQVFNEIQQIGVDKKYDFIFDRSADVVMLYAEKRYDVSDLVLRQIARTRKVSTPKGSNRRTLSDFEEEEALEEEEAPRTDALIERQERAKELQEERAKSAEEKRAAQLKLREERKKAYEERRQKLLDERDAKRKEKEEERKNNTGNPTEN